MPSNYDYIVCEYESLGVNNGEERFFAVMRVGRVDAAQCSDENISSDAGMSTAAEAEQWLQQFETVSRTNWRVDKTYPDTHLKLVYKVNIAVIKTGLSI